MLVLCKSGGCIGSVGGGGGPAGVGGRGVRTCIRIFSINDDIRIIIFNYMCCHSITTRIPLAATAVAA